MSEVISLSSGAHQENKTEVAAKLSIDEVFEEMQQWRKGRTVHRQTRIPDELWHKMLALGKYHGRSKICQIFGLSTRQYQDKETELCPPEAPQAKKVAPLSSSSASGPTPPFPWCEAKQSPFEDEDETGPIPLMTHSVLPVSLRKGIKHGLVVAKFF